MFKEIWTLLQKLYLGFGYDSVQHFITLTVIETFDRRNEVVSRGSAVSSPEEHRSI